MLSTELCPPTPTVIEGIWRWGLSEVIKFRCGQEGRASMVVLVFKEKEGKRPEFSLPASCEDQ